MLNSLLWTVIQRTFPSRTATHDSRGEILSCHDTALHVVGKSHNQTLRRTNAAGARKRAPGTSG